MVCRRWGNKRTGSHGSLFVALLCQGRTLEIVDGGAASTLKDRWNKFKRPSGFAQTKHPEIANASANEFFVFRVFGHVFKLQTFFAHEQARHLKNQLGHWYSLSVRLLCVFAERARELSPLGRCEEDPGIWRYMAYEKYHAIGKKIACCNCSYCSDSLPDLLTWSMLGRPPDQTCGTPDQIVVNS